MQWAAKVLGQRHASRREPRVLGDLRRQIVDGVYPSGGRLPVRTELQRQFGATPVTLQRAFRHLADEGLVVSRGWDGTYVTHLWSRAALVAQLPRSRACRP